MKAVWSIGREREKEHASRYVKAQSQRDLLFPVIDIVHDMNEGKATTDDFIRIASAALKQGGKTVWNSVDKWVLNVSKSCPQVATVWDTLSTSPKSTVRKQVAGRLYLYVADRQSDKLFAVLRHDKSSAVRELAIDRYENRPGPNRNVIFKMFDANDPASPGFSRN